MLEITGNIFDLNSWSRKPTTKHIALCITTNSIVKNNGTATMGAGVALEFAKTYPQLPHLLGQKLRENGNRVYYLMSDRNTHIFSFPTKHHWKDASDLSLIENSAKNLARLALIKPYCTFVLTRPGCGLGRLSWSKVRPLLVLPDNCWIIERM